MKLQVDRAAPLIQSFERRQRDFGVHLGTCPCCGESQFKNEPCSCAYQLCDGHCVPSNQGGISVRLASGGRPRR